MTSGHAEQTLVRIADALERIADYFDSLEEGIIQCAEDTSDYLVDTPGDDEVRSHIYDGLKYNLRDMGVSADPDDFLWILQMEGLGNMEMYLRLEGTVPAWVNDPAKATIFLLDEALDRMVEDRAIKGRPYDDPAMMQTMKEAERG